MNRPIRLLWIGAFLFLVPACEEENKPPTVQILTPEEGEIRTSPILSARVEDEEVSKLGVVWTSDRDGILVGDETWDGDVISFEGVLSSGLHVLTMYASDAAGLSGSASVSFSLNQAPSVVVLSPAQDQQFLLGEPVVVGIQVQDDQHNAESLELVWGDRINAPRQLDSQGGLQFAIDDAAAGSHSIELIVSDAYGAAAHAAVSFHVRAPDNLNPDCEILLPTDGAEYESGMAVTFAGESSDTQDSDLDVLWSSGQQGALFIGPSWTMVLADGIHEISMVVLDNAGGVCTDSTWVAVGGLGTDTGE